MSLVMQVGCRTWVTVRQLVYKASGASRVVGMRSGGVLVGLVAYLVVLELLVVVLSWVEPGVGSSSSNASTVTWRVWWTREAS